jgi:Domain of unknown function (DUF4402)
MNRRARTLAAAALVAGILPPAVAALASLSLTGDSGLGFGQVVATATPGTVTVTPAGTRSASGGVALGNGLGVSAASFEVTGEPNTSYSITLPSAVTLSAGASSMTADNFTSSTGGSGLLGPGGTQSFSVGADLHVGASQPAASYTGTYAVSIVYN